MLRPKWVLVGSLAANLCLLGIGGEIVVKKGGIARLFPRAFSAQLGSTYFEERRDVFESMPRSRSPVIFLGDSLVERCPWSELLQRPGVLNRGVGGETLEIINARLGEVVQRQPSQLFVMAGINDLMQGSTPDQVLARYSELVPRVRSASPRTQISVHSLLPVSNRNWATEPPGVAQEKQQETNAAIKTVNRFLAGLADGAQIVYVDIHSRVLDREQQLDARYTNDCLHLNSSGYAVWAQVIRPLVRAKSG